MSVPAQLPLLNRNLKENHDYYFLFRKGRKFFQRENQTAKNSLPLFSHKSQGFSHDDSFCATTWDTGRGTYPPLHPKNWHLYPPLTSAPLPAPSELFPWALHHQLPFPRHQDKHKISTWILLLTHRIHVSPLTQIMFLFFFSLGKQWNHQPLSSKGLK